VVGLPSRSTWEIRTAEGAAEQIATAEGTLSFHAGEGEVILTRIAEEGKGGFQ
jgi:hypothetical protein